MTPPGGTLSQVSGYGRMRRWLALTWLRLPLIETGPERSVSSEDVPPPMTPSDHHWSVRLANGAGEAV